MATFPMNILMADPDFGSLFGAMLIHYLIWNFASPFVISSALAWVSKHADYVKNIDKNLVEEGKAYGLPPSEYWAVMFRAFCHHGTGGLFMAVGMYLDQPWIWRHGLLVEVGGMDVLDFSQMIATKLGYPIEPWATKYGTPAWVLLACHHMCGILTGFPVCMYFSHVSNYQWIGLILLGGPAPFCLISGIDSLTDHDKVQASWLHLFGSMANFALMFHQRVWLLTPLAIACITDAHATRGYEYSLPFGFGFAFISILDIVFVLTTLKALVLAVVQGHFTPGHAKKLLMRASKVGMHHSHVIHHQHHMKTQVFIASKLLSKAKAAKKSVAQKKGD